MNMEWISVNSRLPLDAERCLIFVPEHNPQIYLDGFGNFSENFYGFAHEFLCGTKVTHWMPIPEPPT